jgi:hypothetical protein
MLQPSFRSAASSIRAKFFILQNFSCADWEGNPHARRPKKPRRYDTDRICRFLSFAVTFPQPFALQLVTELIRAKFETLKSALSCDAFE